MPPRRYQAAPCLNPGAGPSWEQASVRRPSRYWAVLAMNQRDSFVLRIGSAPSDRRSFLKASDVDPAGLGAMPPLAVFTDQKNARLTRPEPNFTPHRRSNRPRLRSETPARLRRFFGNRWTLKMCRRSARQKALQGPTATPTEPFRISDR